MILTKNHVIILPDVWEGFNCITAESSLRQRLNGCVRLVSTQQQGGKGHLCPIILLHPVDTNLQVQGGGGGQEEAQEAVESQQPPGG